MRANSNAWGRAYEYAWINVLYRELTALRQTRIINNGGWYINKKAWNTLSKNDQERLIISAKAAVAEILELEPLLSEKANDELTLEFQRDEVGVSGDVRDIVMKRASINWEIGLSIKHNHEAIKHSRLSYSLDFGKEWFNIPCSSKYWEQVKPLFDRLIAERNRGINWRDLPDKESGVYIPLLNSFMEEIKRAAQSDPLMPKKMVEYLIGTDDYYKIISFDKIRTTSIRTFNVHNTLNKPSKAKKSLINVPLLQLPTELKKIGFKRGYTNTVEMSLDNGWGLSFRIHNASSKVEPSLKFDIQFIQMPSSIMNIERRWK